MIKKEKIGIIVNNKMNKTLTILVQRQYQHPKYKKILFKTKRYLVHNPLNNGHLGEIAIFEESAPISKKKTWLLQQILKTS